MISAVEAIGQEVKAQSDETEISCKITGLAAQATVVWLDTSGATAGVSGDDFTSEQGTLNDQGEQTPTLKVKKNSAKQDKNYYCKVTSGSLPDSDSSETTVPLNVYGEIEQRVFHE